MTENSPNITLRHLRDLRGEHEDLREMLETYIRVCNSTATEVRFRIIAAEMKLDYFEKHLLAPPEDRA